MSEKADVVIIGAGVVGLTAAYELGRAGVSTLVVDAASGIGGGCSYANAGLIAPAHVGPLATPALVAEGIRQMFARPAAVRVRPQPALAPWLARLVASARPARSRAAAALLAQLAERSAALHRGYFESGVNPNYRRAGALDIWLRRRPRGGIPVERARTMAPALGAITAAGHDPDEAVVDSRAYLGAMLAAAQTSGAVEVRFDSPVREIIRRDGRVDGVRVPDGIVRAERVVVAAGLASAAMARSVGVRLPLRGGRGYVVDLQASGDVPTMAIRLKERRIVVTPLPDRLRVCGMIEFGAEGRPRDRARSAAMVAAAMAALPGVRVDAVIDEWCGERPCSADGVPFIGPSQEAPGLSVAAGHGMWGLILAPVTAELLVDHLVGGPATPVARLSADRFTPCRRRGRPARDTAAVPAR